MNDINYICTHLIATLQASIMIGLSLLCLFCSYSSNLSLRAERVSFCFFFCFSFQVNLDLGAASTSGISVSPDKRCFFCCCCGDLQIILALRSNFSKVNFHFNIIYKLFIKPGCSPLSMSSHPYGVYMSQWLPLCFVTCTCNTRIANRNKTCIYNKALHIILKVY